MCHWFWLYLVVLIKYWSVLMFLYFDASWKESKCFHNCLLNYFHWVKNKLTSARQSVPSLVNYLAIIVIYFQINITAEIERVIVRSVRICWNGLFNDQYCHMVGTCHQHLLIWVILCLGLYCFSCQMNEWCRDNDWLPIKWRLLTLMPQGVWNAYPWNYPLCNGFNVQTYLKFKLIKCWWNEMKYWVKIVEETPITATKWYRTQLVHTNNPHWKFKTEAYYPISQ